VRSIARAVATTSPSWFEASRGIITLILRAVVEGTILGTFELPFLQLKPARWSRAGFALKDQAAA
jgi:hypothetical protein